MWLSPELNSNRMGQHIAYGRPQRSVATSEHGVKKILLIRVRKDMKTIRTVQLPTLGHGRTDVSEESAGLHLQHKHFPRM